MRDWLARISLILQKINAVSQTLPLYGFGTSLWVSYPRFVHTNHNTNLGGWKIIFSRAIISSNLELILPYLH